MSLGGTSLNKLIKYIKLELLATIPNKNKLRNKGREIVVVLASAHKVGSTWLYRMLRDINIFSVRPVPFRYRENRRNAGLINLRAGGVDLYLKNISKFRLFKSHSLPPSWNVPNNVKFITVVRDPRDIIISNIHYLANLSPDLGGWPEMQGLSNPERIKLYLKRGVFDLNLLRSWSEYDGCVTVRYEDMLKSPRSSLLAVIEWLDIEIPDCDVDRVIESNSFKRLSSGRAAGQEDRKSFFRKGISGDWKNYFDSDCIKELKLVHGGAWNKLIVDLGYESSMDW